MYHPNESLSFPKFRFTRIVAHPEYRVLDLFLRVHVLEVQRLGAVEQSLQVSLQFEDLAPVHADALPDAIAALDTAVEGRHGGEGTRVHVTGGCGGTDVEENLGIARVGVEIVYERLKGLSRGAKRKGLSERRLD